MIKQLRKVGNCNALIIDKSTLELLELEEGGHAHLTIQNRGLIAPPASPDQVDPQNLHDILDIIIKKRQKVLKRLAQ